MRTRFAAAFTTLLLGSLATPALADPKPDAKPAQTPAEKQHAADLAKAADAAAEVANMPTADLTQAADAAAAVATVQPGGDAAAAPAPAPAAAGPAKSDDSIDLASLGLDPANNTTGFDDKLNLYGFADIGWIGEHWRDNIPGIRQNSMGFFVGNLNLYVSKNITRRWRALGEIHFSYLPNDNTNTANGLPVAAVATDPTNYGRLQQFGSSLIERLYIEYDINDHLTIRAGHWLTPYGIWNIDHGSPAIIATARPYIIGEQMIPEHQTGLQLFGNYGFGDYRVNYAVTASNGRSAAEAQEDLDNDIAFGGRLEIETPFGVRLGGSIYEGKATDFATALGTKPPSFREVAYAGDIMYDHAGFHIQAEGIVREQKYDDGARPFAPGGYAADGRSYGMYALAGYRFDTLWNVMPYTYAERYRPSAITFFQGVDDVNIGLNFRPTPSLVIKAQAAWAKFPTQPAVLSNTVLYIYTSQIAWLF